MQTENIKNTAATNTGTANAAAANTAQAPLAARLIRFTLAIGALVLIVFLAQYPVEMIPAFKTYAEGADKNNIHPGALYYSDVPVTGDSENFTRNAVLAVDEQKRQQREAQITQ